MATRIVDTRYARILVIAITAVITCALPPPVFASSIWSSGSFSLGGEQPYTSSTTCSTRLVSIVGVSDSPEWSSLCMYERTAWRYAFYTKRVGPDYAPSSTSYFVVGLGDDRSMRVVENMSGDRRPIEVPGSDDLVFNRLTAGFTNNHQLTVIRDFPSQLELSFRAPGSAPRYSLKDHVEKPLIANPQGAAITTGAVGVSPNGRWLAIEDMKTGFLLYDMLAHEIHWFSSYKHKYGVGRDAHILFTISNDGRYVATFDYNITPKIYSLDPHCTITSPIYNQHFIDHALTASSCPDDAGRMVAALGEQFSSDQIRSLRADRFSYSGDVLYFQKRVYVEGFPRGHYEVYDVGLQSDGYASLRELEYLALGDSYSSGEGDTATKENGTTFYRLGTEQRGGCHISERSYPYLLKQHYQIATDGMQSVACSGAEVVTDYYRPLAGYQGQGRALAGMSPSEREADQASALEKFIPGKVPQLEFVKRYRPDVITLTGGGNDVGFAEILKYCASPTWEYFLVNDTCGYAIEGSDLEKMLYSSIDTQYAYTSRLLETIQSASPASHVIVVGYPSFITAADSVTRACTLNAGALNNRERRMIDSAVSYMNNMLQKAAHDAGVAFVDTEDSLVGGRLCEGSEYVTGLHTLGIANVLNQNTAESFHPNAAGHQKLAQAIQGAGVFDSFVPAADNQFAIDPNSFASRRAQIVERRPVLRSNNILRMLMPAYSFLGSSTATVTLYSQPTALGELSVDSAGAVSGDIDISGAPIGRHLLVLSGQSPSGEAAKYYQFIEIWEHEDDADGDGVLNESDPCTFIAQWYDEKTGEDRCAVSSSVDKASEPKGYPGLSERHLSVEAPLSLAERGTDEGRSLEQPQTSDIAHAPDRQKIDTREKRDAIVERSGTPLVWIITALIMVGGVAYGIARSKKAKA